MFKYVNEYGDYITIDYTTDEYILKSIDGVDTLKNDISTVKGMYQDGSFVTGTNVDDRDITLSGYYIANVFLKENLIKVFNPKVKGTLYYYNDDVARKLDCVVETSPNFNTGSYLHDFQVRLLASNPYWQDVNETEVLFSNVKPCFEFPVTFTESFEVSTVDASAVKDIINDGDVDAPINIVFTARGTLSNPFIQSSTLDMLKFNLTLETGDRLIINTDYGKKTVLLIRSNGESEKAFKYLDYKSKFMQLKRGESRFTFGASSNASNLSISFKYFKRYVGVY